MGKITPDLPNTHKWKPWLVITIVSFLFFYEFGVGNAYNSLGPFISQTFHLSSTQLGAISSLYFYTNLILLIPAGIILDRYSPRKVIMCVLFISATGTLLTPLAHSVVLLVISRILMGFGAGFSLIGCMRIAINWLEPKHLAKASGLTVTIGMFGGFMVQTPLTVLIAHIGWRDAVFIMALAGYFIVLLISTIRDAPQHETQALQERKAKHVQTGVLTCLKRALLKKQNWLCGLYTSLMNLPIFMLGALWGIPYLTRVEGFSMTDAATISGMLFFGSMLGSPLLGFLSDKLGSRTRPMQICAILSTVLIFLIIEINAGFWVFLILFLLLGIITSAQILSYPTVAESNDKMISSSAISIISMMCVGGGALIQPLFGYLLTYKNHLQISSNLMAYPVASYKFAMYSLPIAFLMALVLSFLIRDTYGKSSV